ncbi:hypothetical protein OAN58_02875 [Paracoccaceae bacterium]|nr:hypothetical protein [Paracoccaceae bacterium]
MSDPFQDVDSAGIEFAETTAKTMEIRQSEPVMEKIVKDYIPLCGQALWAAKRIVASEQTSKFAFSRYNRHSTTKANSASAALNKWLKQYVPIGCTMHSFRHSMRDRLRSVQCPSDIADQIGGWTSEGVGQGYGSGYPLNVLNEWLEKALVGLD